MFDQGPKFQGKASLSFQPQFLEFNPNTLIVMTILVCIRIPNLPLHLWSPFFFASIGNSLGCFIKFDEAQIVQGLVTFARIYVELDLSHVLLDKMLVEWDDLTLTLLLDYENTTFRCKSCQQTRHLQEPCPASPALSPSKGLKKNPKGWLDILAKHVSSNL